MFKFNWNTGQPLSGGPGSLQPSKLHSPQPSLDSQITPKAEFGNPFDALGKANGQQQPPSTAGDTTPMAYSPSAPGIQPLAFPTTQLSLAPPNFTLKSVPTKSAGQKTQTPSNPPKTTSMQSAPSSAKSSTLAPRGQLHVKLIQARGLAVKSALSRPYVVVVYEQNEFVSREPTHEHEKEVKGKPNPLSRQSSSVNVTTTSATAQKSLAMDALGGIQKAFDIKPRAGPSASNKDGDSTPVKGEKNDSPPEHVQEGGQSSSRSSSGSSGGSKDLKPAQSTPSQSMHEATNPVWKHQVSFDVTSERSVLSLNIYDRKYEGIEGYLGTVEIKPALIHDRPVDVWHKLESHGAIDASHPITGELRVQITYEQSQTKRSLTPRDFDILKLIGKGTFGRVFQVRKKDTRRIYAMKVLSKKEIVAKKEVAHTIGERKILQRSLESPFLVGLKFSFQTDTELFLVTDFKSGGELFWHLQRETRFGEERARFYIAELTLALEHLHKHDIVYRDLKPENILLDATGHVALCDFGLSKPDLPANQLTNTFCGTTEYLAPEILLDDLGYSKMVDFWSLGVLLFEMLCGWSPFYNEDTQVMYRNICYGKIKFPRNTVSEEGKLFVKGLLNRVPANRLGSKGDAAELKAHPFFNGIDWVALSRKEVTPPFKPSVESDESTACFDPEFTSADLREVGIDYWDEEEANMVDPVSGQRLYNGPTGSERAMSVGSHAPEGAIDLITPLGSYQQPIPTPAQAKDKRKRRSSSPISSSLQENFRGFSYTASESVDDGWEGLRGRMQRDEELEKLREITQSPSPAEAVGDEEITLSREQISSLRGEFGEADEAMRRMNLGAGRH
ncbi:putative SCH9-serine/threonine protein kinase [Serendipita vermifera]|nr:putative SCH9-serine/threonine protein kinase [Serendipita vermifera]